MRWQGGRQSDNVEDQRASGGGGAGFGLGGRSIGVGTLVVALVGGWMLGINPLTMLGMLTGSGSAPSAGTAPAAAPPAGDERAAFVSTVLANTEDVWGEVLQGQQGGYRPAKLVLFRGRVPTACGSGQSAMGPFYCPGDQKVYIDLDFFDTLSRKLGAPGDFAQAYVIAHEVGHHVQDLQGITAKVDAQRGRLPQAQANALSVRVELQADCYAGVWANRSQATKGWLEAGDVEEALTAASQIGDDTLQRRGQGAVVPESFTHGTSAQRVSWFRRGFQSGQVDDCDTFSASGGA